MVAEMRHPAIIFSLWKATIIQAMEYRASFVFAILANFLDFIFGFLQYMVFFSAAKSIAGWGPEQMLALYGVFMLAFALHFIFLYPNLVAMGEMVNTGNLDLLLTKPVNAQLIISFRRISLEETGSLATAMLLLGYLTYTGTIVLNAVNLLHFSVNFVTALILIYCGFLALLCLAVILEKLDNMSQLMWSMFSLCRYPVDIYPGRLRFIFFSFFPVAFISSVPASALMGRHDAQITASGIIIAVLLLFLCSMAWKKAIKKYTSAGG